MNNDQDNKVIKSVVVILVLILAAGLAGWLLGRGDDSTPTPTNNDVINQNNSVDRTNQTSNDDVISIVSYSLPNGWTEAECPSANGSVYFSVNGSSEVDCAANAEFSVYLSANNQNITECSQIQDVQEVKKHVCKSLYINDLRSIEAETEYLASSTFGRDTTVKTYYIDSGSGIIKAQYVSAIGGSNKPQFEELVTSIRKK